MKDIQQEVLNNQSVVASAGGAPDPDDEDDFFKNLKKIADKSAVHKQFGKFYRDPKTRLWWSKDRGGHGGYHYKVHKEGPTALEWVFNVDKLGNKIIGQHKGPIGQIIPYKELRFLS